MARPTATKPKFENVFAGWRTSPGRGASQKQPKVSRQRFGAPGQPASANAARTASETTTAAAVIQSSG